MRFELVLKNFVIYLPLTISFIAHSKVFFLIQLDLITHSIYPFFHLLIFILIS
jgi:hypothetical protein